MEALLCFKSKRPPPPRASGWVRSHKMLTPDEFGFRETAGSKHTAQTSKWLAGELDTVSHESLPGWRGGRTCSLCRAVFTTYPLIYSLSATPRFWGFNLSSAHCLLICLAHIYGFQSICLWLLSRLNSRSELSALMTVFIDFARSGAANMIQSLFRFIKCSSICFYKTVISLCPSLVLDILRTRHSRLVYRVKLDFVYRARTTSVGQRSARA